MEQRVPNPLRHRFVVGRGQVVPALEEGIVGMKEGGVRQLVFGTDLGYPFIGTCGRVL